MNATQHTPTPWRVVDGWTIEAGTPKAYGIVTCHAAFGIEQKNANAAHIIRCVNAHDELVAVLVGCTIYLDYLANAGNDDAERHLANVRAALAKVQVAE